MPLVPALLFEPHPNTAVPDICTSYPQGAALGGSSSEAHPFGDWECHGFLNLHIQFLISTESFDELKLFRYHLPSHKWNCFMSYRHIIEMYRSNPPRALFGAAAWVFGLLMLGLVSATRHRARALPHVHRSALRAAGRFGLVSRQAVLQAAQPPGTGPALWAGGRHGLCAARWLGGCPANPASVRGPQQPLRNVVQASNISLRCTASRCAALHFQWIR